MDLPDDLIVAFGAAVSTASLVVMLSLLSKYRQAIDDARKSTDLAKSLWDAMDTKMRTQDARIVDLMARLEVYSVRKISSLDSVEADKAVTFAGPSQPSHIPTSRNISQVTSTFVESGRTRKAANDTELTILRMLLGGPKMSNSIRAGIEVTREHNARLLKGLFERGLVSRNDKHKPFVYEITEAGKAYLNMLGSET